MEVGLEGDCYTYRYTVTTRMAGIKMGSDESHSSFSRKWWTKSQDSVHKPQPFWRERRAEAVSNRGHSAYQRNALPLGQTGSHLKMYLWWSLCTFYLHACQVRVTVGESGLCCFTCVTSFERWLTPLCADSKTVVCGHCLEIWLKSRRGTTLWDQWQRVREYSNKTRKLKSQDSSTRSNSLSLQCHYRPVLTIPQSQITTTIPKNQISTNKQITAASYTEFLQIRRSIGIIFRACDSNKWIQVWRSVIFARTEYVSADWRNVIFARNMFVHITFETRTKNTGFYFMRQGVPEGRSSEGCARCKPNQALALARRGYLFLEFV